MFHLDKSNEPTYEWVEIHNPTDNLVKFTNYVIGDAFNLLGDIDLDDSLYAFLMAQQFSRRIYNSSL